MAHVFTYGSLMFAPVWERVVRGNYVRSDAVLKGFKRRRFEGEEYPGILPSPRSKVTGVIYFDVGEDDLAALDAFEGEYYLRGTETLRLNDVATVQADVYVVRPEFAHLMSDEQWSPEQFEKEGMAPFIDKYVGFEAL